jgi:hypothetical protein
MPCDFKFTKANAPTRRASFAERPRWNVLAERIEQLYLIPASNVGVTYRDSDGDEITLNTEDELADFYRAPLPEGEVIRFAVHDLGPSLRHRSRSRTLEGDGTAREEDTRELENEMREIVNELNEAARAAGEAMQEAQKAAHDAGTAAADAATAAARQAAQAAAEAGSHAAEAGRRIVENASQILGNFRHYQASMMSDAHGAAAGMWGAFEGGRRGRGGWRGGRGRRGGPFMHGFFPGPFMGPMGPPGPQMPPPPVPSPPPPPSSSDAMDEDGDTQSTNRPWDGPRSEESGHGARGGFTYTQGPRGFGFARQWRGPHNQGQASFMFDGPPGGMNPFMGFGYPGSFGAPESDTLGAGPSRHGHRHHHHHHHRRPPSVPPSPPSPPTPPSPPSPPSGRRTPHPRPPPPPGGWEDLGIM